MTLIRASLSSRTTGKAPDALLRLVDHFDQNRDAYHSVSYNEAQLRREFIDPLSEALGWDVENRQGNAMPYRDVIFEDSLEVGGATKARHDKMVELVTRMMELKKQQARAPKKQSPQREATPRPEARHHLPANRRADV
ncbi:MAG: hypothetical protein R6X13_01440 [bacterium]